MLRATETLSRVLLSNSRSHHSVNETGNQIVKVPVVTRDGSSQLATRGRAFHTGTIHLGTNQNFGRNCLVLCIDSVTYDSSAPRRARLRPLSLVAGRKLRNPPTAKNDSYPSPWLIRILPAPLRAPRLGYRIARGFIRRAVRW